MSVTDTTLNIHKRPQKCPDCGHYIAPQEAHCHHCGDPLIQTPVITGELRRQPSPIPRLSIAPDHLAPGDILMLQLLPSAACITIACGQSTLLGRGTPPASGEFVDLNEFQAIQHGISRHHCAIHRDRTRLLIQDLHSTNGTYLNDQHLIPGQTYPVRHGDRLILGSLHMVVTFHAP